MTPPLSAVLSALTNEQPVHLGSLIQILDNTNTFVWYSDLVHQYLPEYAQEILGITDIQVSVNRFAERFSQRVFPLNQSYIAMVSDSIDEWDDDEIDDNPQSLLSILADAIPIELYGFDASGLHDLWDTQSLGVCLTALLPATDAILMCDVPGLRPSWFDMATRHVPAQILARIPPEGYSRDHILLAANQCADPDAAIALRWVISATQNPMMDDCFDYETYPFYGDTWEPDTIEYCRALWSAAEPMLTRLGRFIERIASDPPGEMNALIDLMQRTPTPQPDPPPDSS